MHLKSSNKRIDRQFILLFFILLAYSFPAFAQNNTIDSLQKVLQIQPEDTDKVNTLNALGNALRSISESTNANQYTNSALALATKINYKKGKANACNNLGRIYFGQTNYEEAKENEGSKFVIFLPK